MAIIVVLEGPDGGGKTTLAHSLCERFGLKYCRPPENLLSSTTGPSPGLHEWWREQLRKKDRSGVYDRCFYISEPIYTSLSGRQPLVDGPTLALGLNDLWVEGPLMIFCLTDEVAMLENTYIAGRPRLADISDDQQKLKAAAFLYWAAYGTWCTAHEDTILYDYNLHDFAKIAKAYENYSRTKVA